MGGQAATELRSKTMRAVRSADTGPELAVRRLLHHAGFRYRLHDPRLPGKPDIVLRTRRTVVFVHGCFWHQHQGCPRARRPASRQDYWTPKLDRNVERDQRNLQTLRDEGWNVLVVWEGELRYIESLKTRLLSSIPTPLAR